MGTSISRLPIPILGSTPGTGVGIDVEVEEEEELCVEVDETGPLDSLVVGTPGQQVVGDDHKHDQKLHLHGRGRE